MKRIKSKQKKEGKTWNAWVLDEYEIREIAERRHITLSDEQIEEVAKRFSRALFDMVTDWDIILENVVEDVTKGY